LRTDLGRWLALLTHNSGTLVAWTGPGDPAAMAHYCQARADRDADLTHLPMRQCDWPSQARTVRVVSRSALPPVAEPAEIDRLVSASVGGGQPLYRLDTEAIRDLRPDLVLAQDLCAVCAVPSGQVTQALDVLGRQAEVSSLDPGRGPGRRAAGRQGRRGPRAGRRGRRRAERAARQGPGRGRGAGAAPVFALEWGDPSWPVSRRSWPSTPAPTAPARALAWSTASRSSLGRSTWDGSPHHPRAPPYDSGDELDQRSPGARAPWIAMLTQDKPRRMDRNLVITCRLWSLLATTAPGCSL
jgi:hypothetical protein